MIGPKIVTKTGHPPALPLEPPWTVGRKEAVRLSGFPDDVFSELEKLGAIPKPLPAPKTDRKRPVARYHRVALKEAFDGLARRRVSISSDKRLLDEGLGGCS